jgi:hypothetical protein
MHAHHNDLLVGHLGWNQTITTIKKAKTVARAFVEHLVCVHGAPECLILDQGKEFLNEVLVNINNDLWVHHLKTTAYHPQTDGLMERFNLTLQNMLSMYVAEHQCDWDTYIPYVLAAYHCSVNEATRETPFYLVFSWDHYLPINVSLGLPQVQAGDDSGNYQSSLVERLMHAFHTVKSHQLEAQEWNC